MTCSESKMIILRNCFQFYKLLFQTRFRLWPGTACIRFCSLAATTTSSSCGISGARRARLTSSSRHFPTFNREYTTCILSAHATKITSLQQASQRLFSADDSGRLVCWDMSVKRVETPPWKTSDQCQLCNAPFFWNVSAMWQRKVAYYLVGIECWNNCDCGCILTF